MTEEYQKDKEEPKLNYEGKADELYFQKILEENKKQKLRQEQHIQETKEESIEKKYNPNTLDGLLGDH